MKITFEKHDLIKIFTDHLRNRGIDMHNKEVNVRVAGGRRNNKGAATAVVTIDDIPVEKLKPASKDVQEEEESVTFAEAEDKYYTDTTDLFN